MKFKYDSILISLREMLILVLFSFHVKAKFHVLRFIGFTALFFELHYICMISNKDLSSKRLKQGDHFSLED